MSEPGKAVLFLPCGNMAYISEEDYPYLSQFKWYKHSDGKGKFYVCRYITLPNGKRARIYIHREITSCKKGLVVDHKDCDTFNNQRGNLRVCTKLANKRNCIPWGMVPYKGVTKDGHKFRARITPMDNEKEIYIGRFDLAEDAAKAYDKMAKKLFGEFAWVNFPEEYVPPAKEPEYAIPF